MHHLQPRRNHLIPGVLTGVSIISSTVKSTTNRQPYHWLEIKVLKAYYNMSRSARKIINEKLFSLNLSSAEGNILLHLFTQGQEQLVEQLDISKPAVSRALDSLETKGYVTRQEDPGDRRVHRVRLTDQAQAIGPAIEQAYNQLYTIAMQGISQEELDDFVQLFGRISENFSRALANNMKQKQDTSA